MRHREARSMLVVGTCFILIRIKGRGIATCKWQTMVRLFTKEGLFKDAVANTTDTECSCHTFMEKLPYIYGELIGTKWIFWSYFHAKMTCPFIYSTCIILQPLSWNKKKFWFEIKILFFKPTYFLLHVNRYFNKMY